MTAFGIAALAVAAVAIGVLARRRVTKWEREWEWINPKPEHPMIDDARIREVRK